MLPRSEVRMPSGISPVDIVLAASSQNTVKIPPARNENGISLLVSPPMINRVICGTMSPTHPIMPATEMTLAVMATAAISTIVRSNRILTPRDFAIGSSSAMTFNRHRKMKIILVPITTTGKMVITSCQFMEESPPRSQKTISGNCFIGSAMYFRNPTPAEKSAETAMPANTNRTMAEEALDRPPKATVNNNPPKPNTKASTTTAAGCCEMNNIENAAPKAAPWLTPRKPGSTNGLWNNVCITTPAIESEEPSRNARMILGRRKLSTSVCAIGSCSNCATESPGGSGYLPINMDNTSTSRVNSAKRIK